ncbi:hypothetical protein HELRODRAFT_168495 [Helobdella robusta]|uniref:Uncharacterized protein n=1 Tax=Helobdella robusta TaxID=6412 RepID=T1F0M9_HELRO|nr:hypothetical protein HELRODRAFT_168495 [Helobdella robusta]ESO09502.1 hypothetical protein HELRODRAFT_168495 [Helobdella robusta]
MSALPPQNWTVQIVSIGSKCLLCLIGGLKIIYLYAYYKMMKFIDEEGLTLTITDFLEFQRNIKNENYRPDQQWDQVHKLTKEVKKMRRKRIGTLTRMLKAKEEMEEEKEEMEAQSEIAMWSKNPEEAIKKLLADDDDDDDEKDDDDDKDDKNDDDD